MSDAGLMVELLRCCAYKGTSFEGPYTSPDHEVTVLIMIELSKQALWHSASAVRGLRPRMCLCHDSHRRSGPHVSALPCASSLKEQQQDELRPKCRLRTGTRVA